MSNGKTGSYTRAPGALVRERCVAALCFVVAIAVGGCTTTPEGLTGIVTNSPGLPASVMLVGAPGDTTFTASDDNPQVVANAFIQNVNMQLTSSSPDNVCNILSDFQSPANLAQFGPGSFRGCNESYTMGSNPGRDRFLLTAPVDSLWPFSWSMTATGTGTEAEALFVQGYVPDAVPGIGFSALCPIGPPGLANWCPGTYPLMFPGISFRRNTAGTLDPINLSFLRETNSQRQILGTITVVPPAGLLLVPVHIHFFENAPGNQDTFRRRLSTANGLTPAFDDYGAVRSNYDVATDTSTARLTRGALTSQFSCVAPGCFSLTQSERGFLECGVQLRLESVQFHARPSSLLVPDSTRTHTAPVIDVDVGGGNSSDCAKVVADTETAAGRGPSSPIGAQIRSLFAAGAHLGGLKQGIHLFMVDLVTNGSGQVTGGGFGCSMDSSNSVPPFGIVDILQQTQIHEIGHVLGLNHSVLYDRFGGAGQPLDPNSAECQTVRQKAQEILSL